MKLSIITINYNNAEGLRKTLASVAAQTYADIEHIIVDGGSTDGSVDIIREYADDQVKGYRLEVKGEENSIADINASTPYTLHPTPRSRLLSSRKRLSELREYLLNNQKSNPNEEIYIEITQPDPYPLADEPCPLELQQYEIDARRAEQRYLDALQAGLLRSGKS